MTKQYLGDSVYALRDDYSDRIILTTENGKTTDPSNTICLEQDVIAALLLFIEQRQQETSNENESNKATEADQTGTED